MAWRNTLEKLREELDEARAQRLGEPEEVDADEVRDREELYRLADSLQIAQLLVDVNEILLGGSGIVESSSLLDDYEEEEEEDEDEDEDDEEDVDVDVEDEELRFSLSWEEDVECAIDVELSKDENRIYLLVNGDEVRQEREALERAVVEAFKDEIDL